MSRVVLDTSAVLALLLDEPGAAAVRASLDGSVMAAPNLAELVGYFAARGGGSREIDRLVDLLPVEIAPVDRALSLAAGHLRATGDVGLSLGDRYCLALASRLALPTLTADRAWETVGPRVGVEVRLIR
ncbi:PIN domain-containing protein [Salinarimonas rosea]|uniref:PIN domain-containing protein n=1 Tax=Salinarimonas rosea TaxID=552063 RepID=UPI0003FEDEFF|nr:type II toxin-antitoxin system VapC family toxin [Salinarimonas rosea]